jgi:hypothetical protein
MALKLKEVFGVSKQRVQSYLERDAVDGFLVKALGSDNHIIVYGSSKQVQTRVRRDPASQTPLWLSA